MVISPSQSLFPSLDLLITSHSSNFINNIFTQPQSSRHRWPDQTGKSCTISSPEEMGRLYKIEAGVELSIKAEASGGSTLSLDL